MEKLKRAVSQDNDLCGQSCGSLFYGNSLPAQAAPRAQETGERVVIVIDPGHGGDNEGTLEGPAQEQKNDHGDRAGHVRGTDKIR